MRVLANFVHVCKRNDPQIEKCLIQTIESIRPELPNGKFFFCIITHKILIFKIIHTFTCEKVDD